MERWKVFVDRSQLLVPKEKIVTWPAAVLLTFLVTALLSLFLSLYSYLSSGWEKGKIFSSAFWQAGGLWSTTLLAFFFIAIAFWWLKKLVVKLEIDFFVPLVAGFLAVFLAIGLFVFFDFAFPNHRFLFGDFVNFYGLEIYYAEETPNNTARIISEQLLLHQKDCPELRKEKRAAKQYFSKEPVKVRERGFLTWQAGLVSGFTPHNNCILWSKKAFSTGFDVQFSVAFFALFEYLVYGLTHFFLPLLLFQIFWHFFTRKHIWIIGKE